MSQQPSLPPNKRCKDCENFGLCQFAVGRKGYEITCHFTPMRFVYKNLMDPQVGGIMR